MCEPIRHEGRTESVVHSIETSSSSALGKIQNPFSQISQPQSSISMSYCQLGLSKTFKMLKGVAICLPDMEIIS